MSVCKGDNCITTVVLRGSLVTCKLIVRCGTRVRAWRRLRYVLILIMYATAFLLIAVDDAAGVTLR